QLFLDLRLRARVERTEARHGRVPGDLAEKRVVRLAGRQRVVGKLVPEVGKREVERAGELPGVADGVRDVGEERAHLIGRFDEALAVRAEEPAGIVNVLTFTNAGD